MRKQIILSVLFAALCSTLSAQSGGQNPALVMYRWNGGGISPQPVIQGNLIGTVRWDGLTAIGNIRTGASIQSFITDPVAPGILQANMIFRTSNIGGLTNRMIITEEGLVGIGTDNPAFNLHTVGNTHTTGRFHGRIHFDFISTNNDPPSTYTDEAYFERRLRSTLGVPAVAMTNNFGGILTLAPGGSAHDHQLFFGQDGIWNRRDAENSGAWANPWEKLLSSGDIKGRPNLVAKFRPPDNPSSKLDESQLFDNGTNVVIGGIPPGPPGSDPTPAFNLSDLLTVHGNSRINGNLGLGTLPSAFRLDVSGDSSRMSGKVQVIGRVAISSTSNPPMFATGYALSVEGKIITDEVRVMLKSGWSDYVFEENYPLPDLKEWEQFIKANKHLPGIPSAKEVEENGIELGENQRLLLEKIEQLTLIVIEQQKQIDALKTELKSAKH